jgi:hypothetical protein
MGTKVNVFSTLIENSVYQGKTQSVVIVARVFPKPHQTSTKHNSRLMWMGAYGWIKERWSS